MGTRGILEKTDKLSKAPYGEFLVSIVGLIKVERQKAMQWMRLLPCMKHTAEML